MAGTTRRDKLTVDGFVRVFTTVNALERAKTQEAVDFGYNLQFNCLA